MYISAMLHPEILAEDAKQRHFTGLARTSRQTPLPFEYDMIGGLKQEVVINIVCRDGLFVH